jgi:hypothetical protein
LQVKSADIGAILTESRGVPEFVFDLNPRGGGKALAGIDDITCRAYILGLTIETQSPSQLADGPDRVSGKRAVMAVTGGIRQRIVIDITTGPITGQA